MSLFGQSINLTVLGVMWALLAVAAVAGVVLGAAWRDLSLRGKWKKTEKEFDDQLRTQVSSRDAKILDLESQLSAGSKREADLWARVTKLEAAPAAPVYAVVDVRDEEPQELVRHNGGAPPEVI